MSDPAPAAEAVRPAGWRRRHPVLARSLLYGAFVGLAVVAFVLLRERRDDDRMREIVYLTARLDGLGVVYLQDATGREVLGVLDAEFADPGLPVVLRERALRMRGIVLQNRVKDAKGSEAAFGAADALALPPRERGALLVEWAEARVQAGDVDGAVALLDRPEAVRDGPLGLLSAMARSYAEESRGRRREGAAALEAALAAARAPLADGPVDFVETRDWTPAQAATEATLLLTRQGGSAPEAFRRLKSLAPNDFGAQSAAARGLEAAGLSAEAQEAWKAACACDPEEAKAAAGREPALRALDAASREGLKAPPTPGR